MAKKHKKTQLSIQESEEAYLERLAKQQRRLNSEMFKEYDTRTKRMVSKDKYSRKGRKQEEPFYGEG